MAFTVDPERVTDVLQSARSAHLVEWALAYGCAFHAHAAGELAFEGLAAAERDPDLAEAVVDGLARTFEAWGSDGRVAGGLRKLASGLRGPAFGTVLRLVARQQGDEARDFVLAQLDGDDPERAGAVVGALAWIADGRDILTERLGRTPRPSFDARDVQMVLLGRGAGDERAVRLALEFSAEAGGRGEGDVCSSAVRGALGALSHLCAFDHDDLDAWADDVAAECGPVVGESQAHRAAEMFEEGSHLVAAESLLRCVPAAWIGREGAGERGHGGADLACTVLGLLADDLKLRGALVRADGWGLSRLVAVSIARVLDEEGPPDADPSGASLEEAIRALSSPRPRIRNQDGWIARAASFGDGAVGPLAALLSSGPYHAADRSALALAKIGTSQAARALMEAAEGDGDFLGLAVDRIAMVPREVLAPFDAEALERAVAGEDWSLAEDVLDRWREPQAASEPVAEAAVGHLERLVFEGGLVEATADVVTFAPCPEFLEPVWSLWRPGEAALGRMAEVLLAVHGPDDPHLDEVRRDLEAMRSDERLKDALTGQLLMLRLRCRRCRAAYRYDVRDVLVTGAVERRTGLSPREFVVVNDVVKCKRCGAIDEYEWTEDAERTFLTVSGTVMLLARAAGPEREREIMRRGAVTYAHVRSVVGENLPHSETVSRLQARVAEAPDDPERRLRLGNACFTLRRLDMAAAVFSEATTRWPDHVELSYQYGSVLERQERWQEALDAFAGAAESLGPKAPDARELAGSLAVSLRDVSRRLGRPAPAHMLDKLGRLLASLPPEKPPREPPRVGRGADIAGKLDAEEADYDDDSLEVVRPARRSKRIGRNAPCPCGSGRKYKKCCGRSRAAPARPPSPPPSPEGGRRRRVSQRLTSRILDGISRLVPREKFRLALAKWRGESVPADAPFVGDETELMRFNEYLIHDWRPDDGVGRTVLERFLDLEGRRLRGDERSQVDAWLTKRRRGWFEVEKVDKARHVTVLKDCIEGAVAEVYDVRLASHASRGDMFLTAVFPVGNRLEIGAVAAGVPRNVRRPFEAWLRREHASWSEGRIAAERDASWRAFFSDRAPEIEREVVRLTETPPRVVLSTGEEASPGHAVYEVLDRRAAIEALESIPQLCYRGWSEGDEIEGESYGWVHLKDAQPLPFERPVPDADEDGHQTLVIGAYLREQAEDELPTPQTGGEEDIAAVYLGVSELEVQALSKERLDYVRGEVAGRLGAAAREVRVRHRDPNFVRDIWERRGHPKGPEARRDPRLDELGRDLHARHVARWVDEHVPALGGRTPREATSDPELRAELEAILRDMEECERRAPRGDAVTGSVARIRRELGMEQGPA